MIGNLRVGCFEAAILSKALKEMDLDWNENPETIWTAEEYEHGIVLKGRIDKMIREKDC